MLNPGTVLIDPDALARERGLNAVSAGRAVLSLVREHLAAGSDLLVETTLAGHNTLRLMTQAHAHGYDVRLLYVGTGDPTINLARIGPILIAIGMNGTLEASRAIPGWLGGIPGLDMRA
jgi:predicted ABC-type ATPase